MFLKSGDKVDSNNAFIKGSAETKDGVTYGVYSNVNATLKNYG